jgi:hypothetical protein
MTFAVLLKVASELVHCVSICHADVYILLPPKIQIMTSALNSVQTDSYSHFNSSGFDAFDIIKIGNGSVSHSPDICSL